MINKEKISPIQFKDNYQLTFRVDTATGPVFIDHKRGGNIPYLFNWQKMKNPEMFEKTVEQIYQARDIYQRNGDYAKLITLFSFAHKVEAIEDKPELQTLHPNKWVYLYQRNNK